MIDKTKHLLALSLVGVLAFGSVSIALAHEWHSHAPFLDEAEAVAAGEKIGIGQATIEGPGRIEARAHGTWTVVYKAGRAGIKPKGGIRICFRHVHSWSNAQGDKPKAVGYTTVKAHDDLPVDVVYDFNQRRGQLVWDYFPWQHMVEVRMKESGLEPGQTIRVTYGDTSQGSPGMLTSPFDETAFTFKVFVDALGTGQYLPLAESPSIEVIAAKPAKLSAILPSQATVGQSVECRVRAEDIYGNPTPSYRGTVELQCEAEGVRLSSEAAFVEADRGVRVFGGIQFAKPGIYRLIVNDGEIKATSNPIRVTEEPQSRKVFWGDLHGHTLFSDGRGTVEEFYDFAENVAGLDFCAVTDHAYEVTDAMWAHSKKVTNAVNKPGKFVTFQAYEWSGRTLVGGDHNLYFLDPDPPIYRSRSYYTYQNLQAYHGPEPQVNHIEDIFAKLTEHLENKNVMAIPHFGGRRGNPQFHNRDTQRLIEVFSEHQRSEGWMNHFLTRGYELGIIASTDGHYGNPGYGYLKVKEDPKEQEVGMALAAVLAEEKTRPSIFHSLYDRHTYATSGDRILLEFKADGHLMGSSFEAAAAPKLEVFIAGTSPVTLVEIKKNSQVVHSVEPDELEVELQWADPEFEKDARAYYYVRVVQANNEEAISSPIWVK